MPVPRDETLCGCAGWGERPGLDDLSEPSTVMEGTEL